MSTPIAVLFANLMLLKHFFSQLLYCWFLDMQNMIILIVTLVTDASTCKKLRLRKVKCLCGFCHNNVHGLQWDISFTSYINRSQSFIRWYSYTKIDDAECSRNLFWKINDILCVCLTSFTHALLLINEIKLIWKAIEIVRRWFRIYNSKSDISRDLE